MINPADYKAESWVFVYPVDGGPELRSMQFGTLHAATMQQEIFVLERTEGMEKNMSDEDYQAEVDVARGETAIVRINTASLNVQNVILELLCGVKDPEWELGMGSTTVFALIERLLPDYDPAMYKWQLETRWEELRTPQYPHDIRAESSDCSSFPPYSVRTGEDEWLDGGFKTIEQALEFCKIRMGDAVTIGNKHDLVLCIQNGHENTIESYDIESWRNVPRPPYTVKDPDGDWEESGFDTIEEATKFAEEQVGFNRGEGQNYSYECHIYDCDNKHIDTIGD